MALKIFVDFDGTITKRDVGNAFFREFGGPLCDAIVDEYKGGMISAHECFRREGAAIGTLHMQDAATFLKHQPIDEGFKQLVAFCEKRGIEITIVSDGLDFYIKEILAANGIDTVQFFANVLELQALGRGDEYALTLRFPYSDAECTRCACCKRNIMLSHAGDDDVIVFIGEGYSDMCPAQYADIVFAKDELQAFCQRENISYFLYESFTDVVNRLQQLLTRKTLRKRRRAELKRREVFMRE
jgi:2,3-diketo-5-methylthio-1-phosphopentane phosphatase